MMDLNQELLEFMEVEPTPESGLASLVTPGNDIPAKREKLAVLVSTGKAKEVVDVNLTHDCHDICIMSLCNHVVFH